MVSVLNDFHEVASLIGAEAVGSPIVEDGEIGLGESAEQASIATTQRGNAPRKYSSLSRLTFLRNAAELSARAP